MDQTERGLTAERGLMKKFKRSALWSYESKYKYVCTVEIIGFTRYSDRAL